MPDAIEVRPGRLPAEIGRLPRALRLAFRLAAQLRRGRLEAILPDGRRFAFGGDEPGPTATMIVRNPAFASRLISGGDIGIAEAFLRGDWDTPDLTSFLYLFTINHELIESVLAGRPILRWLQMLRHWLNRNTRRRARHNIKAHYDLGNRFYAAWLDPTMTYSSALFEHGDNDLGAAQLRKYRSLAERISLKPGQTMLDIGCGWGGFAEFAAKTYDVKVVGLTISREQHEFARARMAEQGLGGQVEIKLQDYRDERGTYDRIASIEMIEAVGEAFWPVYFRQLQDRLVPGGVAGIQAITIQDRFFAGYRRELDFIRRIYSPAECCRRPACSRRWAKGSASR